MSSSLRHSMRLTPVPLVRELLSAATLLLAGPGIGLSQAATDSAARAEVASTSGLRLGVLGAANVNAFRVVGTQQFAPRPGGAGGLWMTLPVWGALSLELQGQFSSLQSRQRENGAPPALLRTSLLNQLSFPAQVRVRVWWLALTGGGQLDVPISVVESPNTFTVDDIPRSLISLTGGLELFPRSRVSLYGRYIYGLTSLDRRAVPDSTNLLYPQSMQAGIKVRLFGSEGAEAQTEPDRTRSGARPSAGAQPAARPAVIDACLAENPADRPASCGARDSDGDGVIDRVDKCVNVPGPVREEGCPPPDADGDGVLDAVDKCPSEPGPAQRGGCPLSDSDNDGILDEVDKCPYTAGAVEAAGCPVLERFSPQAVTFAQTSARLTDAGKAELDKVVEYLLRYPDIKVLLTGHTDALGDAAENLSLSQRRAAAARDYLVLRTIAADRVEIAGRGETSPIASNNSATGRAANRRVEITVR